MELDIQTKPNPRLEENVCFGKFKSRHGRERRKIQKENNEKKKEREKRKTMKMTIENTLIIELKKERENMTQN